MIPRYALLDEEGNVIRWFDHAAKGAVEIKEPKPSYDQLLAEVGECLL